MSGLRLDIFGQPLTNSYNRQVRRGETASGNAAGVQSWPTKANAETNGETENAPNVGQLGSCGSTCGVNNMEGNRWENRDLAPQVGLEPTTLRLTAERLVAASRCKHKT